MKPQKIFGLVLLALVLALGWWWFNHTAPVSVPEKASVAAKPLPLTPPAPIASPKLAPVSVNASTAPSSPASAQSTDPQADLKTAIPDMVRLIREGDSVAFYQTYTPPNKIDPVQLQRLQAIQNRNKLNPVADPAILSVKQATTQSQIHDFEMLEDQTPTLNAAGDVATFVFIETGSGGKPNPPVPVTFVKIDGKWYYNGRP